MMCVLRGFASCCLCFNNLKGGTSQNNKLPPISHYVNFWATQLKYLDWKSLEQPNLPVSLIKLSTVLMLGSWEEEDQRCNEKEEK